MVRFFILEKNPLTVVQLAALNKAMGKNNILANWETNDIINVDGAYSAKMESILVEQGFAYTTKLIDVPFANITIKRNLDEIINLTNKILKETNGNESIYLVEEKEVLDALNNLNYVYDNYFKEVETEVER